jgi:hypothetical protein
LGSIDALAAKYAGKVKFVLVYSYEAHPEQLDTYGIHGAERKRVAEPHTLAARRDLAADFRDYYHLNRPIVVDDFDEKSADWNLVGVISYKHPLVILDAGCRVIQRMDCPAPEDVDRFLADLPAE